MSKAPVSLDIAVINAAGEALEDAAQRLLGRDLGTVHRDKLARVAIEAAVAAEREQIAQAIELAAARLVISPLVKAGMERAARIARTEGDPA